MIPDQDHFHLLPSHPGGQNSGPTPSDGFERGGDQQIDHPISVADESSRHSFDVSVDRALSVKTLILSVSVVLMALLLSIVAVSVILTRSDEQVSPSDVMVIRATDDVVSLYDRPSGDLADDTGVVLRSGMSVRQLAPGQVVGPAYGYRTTSGDESPSNLWIHVEVIDQDIVELLGYAPTGWIRLMGPIA